MVKWLLEEFRKYYADVGDRDIIELFKMRLGLYIRKNWDGSTDYMRITKNQNPNQFKTEEEKALFLWFRTMDYYSQILASNKALSPNTKQFLNNNYMTLFMKYSNLVPEKKKKESDAEYEKRLKTSYIDAAKLEKFYNTVEKNQAIEAKVKANSGQKESENGLLKECPDFDSAFYKQCKDTMTEQLEKIRELAKENPVGENEYVKVFFEADVQKYIDEEYRYLVGRIFCDNDYNIEVDGLYYGLPSFNMTVNDKKPYLINNTTSFQLPFRVSIKDAILIKKMTDLLDILKLKIENKNGEIKYIDAPYKSLYISSDFSFYNVGKIMDPTEMGRTLFTKVIKAERQKSGFAITSQECIPFFEAGQRIPINNLSGLRKDGIELPPEYPTFSELESMVKRVLFSRSLPTLYLEYKDIDKNSDLNPTQKSALSALRDHFYEFFHKGNDQGIKSLFDRYSLPIITAFMRKGENSKAKEAFNLRVSLLNYLNKGGECMTTMKVNDMKGDLLTRLVNNEEQILENDKEFYFLIGQMGQYLASHSQAKSKNLDLLYPFTTLAFADQLKQRLYREHNKYAHDIDFYNSRYKNAMTAVAAYCPINKRVDKDALVAGLMSTTLFYTKTKISDVSDIKIIEREAM